MSAFEIVIGLVMVAGLVGVVLPVAPGMVLIVGAAIAWAVSTGGTAAWVVTALLIAIGAAASAIALVVPAKRAGAAGAPAWVMLAGGIGLVVGFFTIPVIGALIGWAVGIWVGEMVRLKAAGPAWSTTVATIRGQALGMAIQLTAGVIMIAIWLAAAITIP